jgi:hypothetical protein
MRKPFLDKKPGLRVYLGQKKLCAECWERPTSFPESRTRTRPSPLACFGRMTNGSGLKVRCNTDEGDGVPGNRASASRSWGRGTPRAAIPSRARPRRLLCAPTLGTAVVDDNGSGSALHAEAMREGTTGAGPLFLSGSLQRQDPKNTGGDARIRLSDLLGWWFLRLIRRLMLICCERKILYYSW